jgi:hypothetical protein
MDFNDLPDDWAQRPITDIDVFEGVIDLIASDRSRVGGAVHLLLCHESGRLLQPLMIEAPDWDDAAEDIVEKFATAFAGLRDHGVPAVVVAIARPGGTSPTLDDLKFLRAVEAASVSSGLALLGLAVAAPDGVVTVSLECGAQERERHLYGDEGLSEWLSA